MQKAETPTYEFRGIKLIRVAIRLKQSSVIFGCFYLVYFFVAQVGKVAIYEQKFLSKGNTESLGFGRRYKRYFNKFKVFFSPYRKVWEGMTSSLATNIICN